MAGVVAGCAPHRVRVFARKRLPGNLSEGSGRRGSGGRARPAANRTHAHRLVLEVPAVSRRHRGAEPPHQCLSDFGVRRDDLTSRVGVRSGQRAVVGRPEVARVRIQRNRRPGSVRRRFSLSRPAAPGIDERWVPAPMAPRRQGALLRHTRSAADGRLGPRGGARDPDRVRVPGATVAAVFFCDVWYAHQRSCCLTIDWSARPLPACPGGCAKLAATGHACALR